MSKAEETTLNYNFQDDVKGKKKRKNKKIVRPTNYIPLYNLPLRIGSVSRSDGQTKIYIMEDFNLFWDLFRVFLMSLSSRICPVCVSYAGSKPFESA